MNKPGKPPWGNEDLQSCDPQVFGQAAVEQAAAAAGESFAAVAAADAAGVGGTVVHVADAVDFVAHPDEDGTDPAGDVHVVVGDTGIVAGADVLVAEIAAVGVLAAEIVAALVVDAVADSDRSVCVPAPVDSAAPPAHSSLASPCQSETIKTCQR